MAQGMDEDEQPLLSARLDSVRKLTSLVKAVHFKDVCISETKPSDDLFFFSVVLLDRAHLPVNDQVL